MHDPRDVYRPRTHSRHSTLLDCHQHLLRDTIFFATFAAESSLFNCYSCFVMAGPKYTAAPQRDSLDDAAHYPQAPPSYQNAPSSNRDQDTLLGGQPRGSEADIPDDFKVSEAWNLTWQYTNAFIVRWLCRGGDSRHSHAVRSQSLRYPVRIPRRTNIYNSRLMFLEPCNFWRPLP